MDKTKCVVIGDDCVGKTSLLITYNTDTFPSDFVPTVYDSLNNKSNSDIPLNFDFLDTTNEHPQLIQFLYDKSDVFIICFSLVSPKSMENVLSLFSPSVKKFCPNAPIVLVGTKSDLRDEFHENQEFLASKGFSPISKTKGEELMKQIHAQSYIECSALKKINVNEVFESAANLVLHKKEFEKKCCSAY